jgi:DegV family protein with EDD domain
MELTVKIVTDSTCDIPEPMVTDLGITVVPEYLCFGRKLYRDGVDINPDEFYKELQINAIHPTTSQPSPQDFLDVYQGLKGASEGILSIHISGKLSGTVESARIAANKLTQGCKIEVLDSLSVTSGLGLLVIEAAKMARTGMDLPELLEKTKRQVSDIHMLGFFDTLKYLAAGGRIGRAKALLGSVLDVKALLSVKDGEMTPVGQVRTRSRAADRLYEFASKATNIRNLSIVYSTTPDEAQTLAWRLNGIFPKERTVISQLSSALGVHGGPGVIFVAMLANMPQPTT